MNDDAKNKLTGGVALQSRSGSGVLTVSLVLVAALFATCGSTCGGGDTEPKASDAGMTPTISGTDLGSETTQAKRSSSSSNEGPSANLTGSASTSGHHHSGQSSNGASSSMSDGTATSLDGATSTPGPTDAGGMLDAAPAGPAPLSCYYDGQRVSDGGVCCNDDPSDGGICGGCLGEGELANTSDSCCNSLQKVHGYCGTNACAWEGEACVGDGGKMCCLDDCNANGRCGPYTVASP